MREFRILLLAGLLLAVCACTEAGTLVGDDEEYRDLRTNRPPEVTEVQIPDSLFLTVGDFVIFLDVQVLFRDDEALTFSGMSSDTTVATITVWRRNNDDRYTDQAIINAVGVGDATVTLSAREKPFDQLDRRPSYQRPSNRSATRSMAVRVSGP